MTPQERAAWCNAQADELEKDLPSQEDPHEFCAKRALAFTMRDLAKRVLAAHGLGPWPSEERYWDPLA